MKRWKILVLLLLLVAAATHINLTTPVQEYTDEMTHAYRKWGFSSEGRWRMWRATRWYAGRFRSSPDDEDMIEYFNENRATFEALVASYYEAMQAPGSESTQSEILVRERMSIGIDSFGIAGPWLSRNTGAGSFFNIGVSLSLMDSGPTPWWSWGRRTYKDYYYVPEELPSFGGKNMTPLDNLLATGEYILEDSADAKLRNKRWPPCSLRQVDRNWFIARCIQNWD